MYRRRYILNLAPAKCGRCFADPYLARKTGLFGQYVAEVTPSITPTSDICEYTIGLSLLR